MTDVLDEYSDYYADLLDNTYDCVDRIVLNAYLRMGQGAGGFRTWWRQLRGSDDNLDNTHLMRVGGSFQSPPARACEGSPDACERLCARRAETRNC